MKKISTIFLLFISYLCIGQHYITNSAKISFFSEAPLEDISAINQNVGAIYDSSTKEFAFQLNIEDFKFKKELMREHFNENYLESHKFPTSTFIGKIIKSDSKQNLYPIDVVVEGVIKIHGIEKNIIVKGVIDKNFDNNQIEILTVESKFSILLKDFKVKIPKIVIHNIAEEIEITVNARMSKIQ